jgi:DNA-binding transcriptional LysR family regulator
MKRTRGNTFRDLQIFAAIAEFGNYTDAAIKLGIDATSVRRRISALEEKLNHLLVIKEGKSIRITPEGILLYQEFIQQERLFKEMLAEFQSTKQVENNNTIDIIIPNGIIEYILAAKLPQYLQNNLDVRLNLTCDNLNTNILAEKYDFVILRTIPSQNQLVIKKLYNPKFYLYCTPEYIQRYGIPQTIDELSSHMLIHRTYANIEEQKYFYASNGVETMTFVNNSRFGTSSSTTDKNIVMGNHAIVSGTDALYEMELKRGTIIKIFPEYYFSDDSNGFYLIYDKNRPPNKTVQNLIDFIIAIFDENNND